ncbi:MAG: GNAT family N-acetyltransferase [Anaerolineae bacterium]
MKQTIIRDMGDGLVLRRAASADTKKLVAFNAEIHRDPSGDEPEIYVGAWVRDLMEGRLPTFRPGDFTLVEDTATGEIVSCLCLISQTWTYGGIPFGVGRPELVGTHPDYRRRGLVRAQMDVVHGWSAERGERVQAITGIPWYYRQFGYEMAMTLGGWRSGYGPNVPQPKEGEEPSYRLRPAGEEDITFIAGVYRQGTGRYPVACVWDEALLRCELLDRSENNVNRRGLAVIETVSGEPLGFIAYAPRVWKGAVGLSVYELLPGASWLEITPVVARYLWSLGEAWVEQDPDQELKSFYFWLGAEHPAYEVFRSGLPRRRKPYAWYLRVPDVPAFLRHVTPVLERRLAGSILAGHSGEIEISFYRSGVRLAFEEGRLVRAEPWQPKNAEDGKALFPDLTFLQLLFGYRSLEELDDAFADCGTRDDGSRLLLEALFPRQSSDVWPVS